MAKPSKTYKFGSVQAAVWEKEVETGKKSFVAKSVTIQKNYKGKDGKWASTNSFSLSDIPYIVNVLNEVFVDAYKHDTEVDDVAF